MIVCHLGDALCPSKIIIKINFNEICDNARSFFMAHSRRRIWIITAFKLVCRCVTSSKKKTFTSPIEVV